MRWYVHLRLQNLDSPPLCLVLRLEWTGPEPQEEAVSPPKTTTAKPNPLPPFNKIEPQISRAQPWSPTLVPLKLGEFRGAGWKQRSFADSDFFTYLTHAEKFPSSDSTTKYNIYVHAFISPAYVAPAH